jgi:hypothetical protein
MIRISIWKRHQTNYISLSSNILHIFHNDPNHLFYNGLDMQTTLTCFQFSFTKKQQKNSIYILSRLDPLLERKENLGIQDSNRLTDLPPYKISSLTCQEPI